MDRAPEVANELQLTADEVAAISRALADPRRFSILQQVATQPTLPCSGLNAHGCISAPTISHHIKELQHAGLVTVEREGRGMLLALRRDVWDAYLRHLGTLL